MESVAIETPSYSALSAFLEDFPDRNSHLFPSINNDLSFEVVDELDNSQSYCGKRKRESSYDSFGGWTDDFLSCESAFDTCESEDVLLSGETTSFDSDQSIFIKEEQSDEHVDKKRKLEDDELNIILSDARSRSPPFQALDFDLDSVPVENILAPKKIVDTEEIPSQKVHSPISTSTPEASPQPTSTYSAPMPSSLTNVLNIISQTNGSMRNAMYDSLSRLANNLEKGKAPVSFSKVSTPMDQLELSQDYMAMGMTLRPPTVVKAEQYYPITAAGIPFVMNSPYVISNLSMKAPVHEVSMFASYKPNTANNIYTNACGKNIAYAKLIPQTYTPQTIYTHPSGSHHL